MVKFKRLSELVKDMDENEYHLYKRHWKIAMVGMPWNRMKEAENR